MKILLTVAIIVFSLSAVSRAFAQVWTQTSATTNLGLVSVAISADGSKIVAVGTTPAPPYNGLFCMSTDSGGTWISNSISINEVTHISSSADGNRLALASQSEPVYVSTNAGQSWAVSSATVSGFGVATSANGFTLVAEEATGSIAISTNSGVSWTAAVGTSGETWRSFASSADGTKLVAVATSGQIFNSTNSGSFWSSNAIPVLTWVAVASSADGNDLAAAPSGTPATPGGDGIIGSVPIYVSTNTGASWSTSNSPRLDWRTIACSADGKKMIAAGSNINPRTGYDSIFTSSDYGMTWVSNNIPSENWSSVAISADGNLLVAATVDDGIWILKNTPSPQLNLTTSDTNFALSWLISSTNFVVQQSPDLLSWSSLTDAPAFNFTNLNYGLTLSPSNSTSFFRLISQ